MPNGDIEKDRIGPRALGILTALDHAGISIVLQDSDLNVLWSHNLPDFFLSPADAADHEVIPGEDGARIAALKRRVMEEDKPAHTEASVFTDGRTAWFELWVDPTRQDGKVGGVMTTIAEITDRKRREHTLRALLREVSHRSRNLLAIVQSIAAQTARHSDTMERFLTRFRGRIQSMASSQDLVTSSNWRGAMLRELVESQIARYRETPARTVSFSGVDAELSPNAALHVGLGLHELIVNSMSFGALADPAGSVELTSRGEGDALRLEWVEKTSVADGAVERPRFGSVALQNVVPRAIGGEASYEIGPDGLIYTLVIPSSQFRLVQAD